MARMRQLLASCLLLAWVANTSAALMAIDLGSEYLKVCLVKPSRTPGRAPITVVVNEMSKRKSPALVGLVNDDRLIGEEAYSFAIRYPDLIFSQARDLLGRTPDDPYVQELLKQFFLPYNPVSHPVSGTVALAVNQTTAYTVEELVASILHYAKQITEAQSGGPVPDAVITVPAWFGIAQRQALINAAGLAGVNVLALINTHAAAALQFGIEREFADKEQKVILYDMGSSSTEVALIKYSTYSSKEGGGKPKPINQLEVLDVEWDATLGSNLLDMALAEHFADAFANKTKLDIRPHPKAMAKLKRQVRRTKEVLSANSGAPFNVEELHEGRDYAAHITRDTFEGLAGDFWSRAAAPLLRLLARNNLKPSDVDAVELLGGGSRVPRVQAALTEALGGRPLDRHLDADEATVLGAGLFAANLSTSFRLKKFGLTDVAMYGVTFESEDLVPPAKAGAGGEDDEGPSGSLVLKNLLPAGKKLPIKRAIKYTNLTQDAFSFRLRYNESAPHGLPLGVSDPLLGEYSVSGVQDAVERYNYSGTLALRFEADYSGLIHFTSADCTVETEVMEEKIVEVPVNTTGSEGEEPAEGGKKGGKKGSKWGWKGKGKEDKKGAEGEEDKAESDKGQEAGSEEGEGGNATDVANKTATVVKTILVPKRKTFQVNLNVTGPGLVTAPISGKFLTAARANLSSWLRAERVKRDTAKAKNDLEAYIIATREALESDELLQKVTTEEQRAAFREQLTDAEDWLYGDGEHEDAAGYRKKLSELSTTGQPMTKRRQELDMRPRVISVTTTGLELMHKVIAAWPETKPWLKEGEVTKIKELVSEFDHWFKDKLVAQSKLEPHQEPVLIAEEVITRWEALEKKYNKLNNKRKPRPPPPPPKPAENATESEEAAAAAEAAAAEAAASSSSDQQKQQQQDEAAQGEQQQEASEGGAGASDGDDAAASEGSSQDEDLPEHTEL